MPKMQQSLQVVLNLSSILVYSSLVCTSGLKWSFKQEKMSKILILFKAKIPCKHTKSIASTNVDKSK